MFFEIAQVYLRLVGFRAYEGHLQSEISLQLEFQRLTKEMTLQNTKGSDTGTEILTISSRSGGSIDSVRVRQ